MLTRKQKWRRVRGVKRVGGEVAAAGAAATKPTNKQLVSVAGKNSNNPPSCRMGTWSTGGSPLRQLNNPHHSKECGDDNVVPTATASTATSYTNGTRINTRVRFNQRVRVVLVPCARELRDFSAQLWWADEDYLNFRRDYVLAVQSALIQREKQEQEDQPWLPEETTAVTTATITAAGTPPQEYSPVFVDPTAPLIGSTHPMSHSSPPSPFPSNNSLETPIPGAGGREGITTPTSEWSSVLATKGISTPCCTSTAVTEILPAAATPVTDVRSGTSIIANQGYDEGGSKVRKAEISAGEVPLTAAISPKAPVSAAVSAMTAQPLCVQCYITGDPTNENDIRGKVKIPQDLEEEEGAEDDLEDDGYRTHSLSSVSDSTNTCKNAESDDEGERRD